MPSDSSAAKQALRDSIRAARRRWRDAASAADVGERAELLAQRVIARPDVATACAAGRVVTCFASLPSEPPTSALLDALRASGADVLLPVVRPERTLHWKRYEGRGSLVPARMGIPEPVGPVVAASPSDLLRLRPAVLLIPALAVDESGARLGQGGGFYDTLLDALPRELPVIAIVGPEGALPIGSIPLDAHDRPVTGRVVG